MRNYFSLINAMILCVALLLGVMLGFTSGQDYQLKRNTAEADQKDGLYLFHEAKPVGPYEVLGSVKAGVVTSEYFEDCQKNLVKKAKKEYPTAEGIIFDLNAIKADVIKFK